MRYLIVVLFLVSCGGAEPAPFFETDAGVDWRSSESDAQIDTPDSRMESDSLVVEADSTPDLEAVEADSGLEADSGTTPPDAGVPAPDSSIPQPDSFVEPDSGVAPDVGSPTPDVWVEPDEGLPDAGLPDSSSPDASPPPPVPGTWIPVPGGSFLQGSKPPCLSDDQATTSVTRFMVQTTEVTNEQWSDVMTFSVSHHYTPWDPQQPCGKGKNCPVENMTWHNAAAYCNELSKLDGLAQCYNCTNGVLCNADPKYTTVTCPGYRLPTKAEWEFAYRVGATTGFYNGESTKCLGANGLVNQIGWYKHNSTMPQPVGQKLANGFGLYDMAGNVEEWLHDGTVANGSYLDETRNLRAGFYTTHWAKTDTSKDRGFRCVRKF